MTKKQEIRDVLKKLFLHEITFEDAEWRVQTMIDLQAARMLDEREEQNRKREK